MTISRVRYRERQILRADDLNDEQEYRMAGHRRHLIGQHVWGIVQGLRLQIVPGGFVVQAGVAVDGFGRELIVPRPIFTPWIVDDGMDLFDAIGSDTFQQSNQPDRLYVDAWLLYVRVSAATPRRGWQLCEQNPPRRWHDATRVCFTAVHRSEGSAGPPPVDAHHPPLVPGELRPLAPHADMPDDPQREWPVFLGRLVRQSAARTPYAVSHIGRPYAGLLGASIVSASRVAVLEDPKNPPPMPLPPVPSIQMTARAGSGERRRVSVALADDKGAVTERMVLDSASGVALRGTTTLVRTELPPPDPDHLIDRREQANDLFITSNARFSNDDLADPEQLACLLTSGADFLIAGQRLTKRELAEQIQALATDRTDPLAYVRSRFFSMLARHRRLTPRTIEADTFRLDQATLVKGLNLLLGDQDLLNRPRRFTGLQLRTQTRVALAEQTRGYDRILANRALIEDLFADQLTQRDQPPSAHGIAFRPPKEQPVKAPAPWRVSSVDIERDGKPARQLRIEIGTSGDKQHPERNQLVVGHAGGEGFEYQFEPCLMVDEFCTVSVAGSMTVVGELIENPIPTEPGDLGLLEQLAEEWQRGIAEGVQEQANLSVQILNLNQAQNGTNWPYDVAVTNTGTTPINFISVLESFSVAGAIHPTRTAGTVLSLPAGDSTTVHVVHPENLNAAGQVSVVLTVLGFSPTFNVMYVPAAKVVPIVP